MNKTTLYILCGLPYSGKTTLTKELVKRFGYIVVSMDEVIDKKNYDPEFMTQEQWNEVYSEGYENLKGLLKRDESTILDLGNLKRSERNTAREIAESLGADNKLIYVKTSKEEIERRRMTNVQTKERGHLEDTEMERAYDMWEEPTPEENPIIINPETNLEEWIKKI